jgi:hypothetical protein
MLPRVTDETGSRIELELNQDWPDLWKLRWLATIVSDLTGVWINISQDPKGGPWFGYSYHDGVSGVGSTFSLHFPEMWAKLHGIETGYRIAKNQAARNAAGE